MALAYANCTTVFADGTRKIRLHEGDIWDADDPFVKERPDLFSVEPTKVQRTKKDVTVEQATAAPGEKRGARS